MSFSVDQYLYGPTGYRKARTTSVSSSGFHSQRRRATYSQPLSVDTIDNYNGDMVRRNEKEILQALNDRFAGYIDKVRNLELHNRHLEAEAAALRQSQAGRASVGEHYERELGDLRDLLQQLTGEKSRTLLEQEHLEEDIQQLRARLEDEARNREEMEAAARAMTKYVDECGLTRLDLDKKLRALEEEAVFLKKNREEEVADLLAQIQGAQLSFDVRDSHKADVTSALREIRAQLDTHATKSATQTGEWFKVRMERLSEAVMSNQDAIRGSQDEISEYRRQLQSRTIELETLRGTKESLERQRMDCEDRHHGDINSLQETINQLDSELKSTRWEMASQLKEYQELLNVKMALDIEIAAYRKLLEGEENRFVSAGGPYSYLEGRVSHLKMKGEEISDTVIVEEQTDETQVTEVTEEADEEEEKEEEKEGEEKEEEEGDDAKEEEEEEAEEEKKEDDKDEEGEEEKGEKEGGDEEETGEEEDQSKSPSKSHSKTPQPKSPIITSPEAKSPEKSPESKSPPAKSPAEDKSMSLTPKSPVASSKSPAEDKSMSIAPKSPVASPKSPTSTSPAPKSPLPKSPEPKSPVQEKTPAAKDTHKDEKKEVEKEEKKEKEQKKEVEKEEKKQIEKEQKKEVEKEEKKQIEKEQKKEVEKEEKKQIEKEEKKEVEKEEKKDIEKEDKKEKKEVKQPKEKEPESKVEKTDKPSTKKDSEAEKETPKKDDAPKPAAPSKPSEDKHKESPVPAKEKKTAPPKVEEKAQPEKPAPKPEPQKPESKKEEKKAEVKEEKKEEKKEKKEEKKGEKKEAGDSKDAKEEKPEKASAEAQDSKEKAKK